MAEYGFSDINEAKRRVQEMKSRAKEQTEAQNDIASVVSALPSNKDKALALSVMYLMNNETADDSLFLALIYILCN